MDDAPEAERSCFEVTAREKMSVGCAAHCVSCGCSLGAIWTHRHRLCE